MIKLLIYAISLLASTFAISGINFDQYIKKNHIWEARFLSIILILCISYLLANFIFDIISLKLIS